MPLVSFGSSAVLDSVYLYKGRNHTLLTASQFDRLIDRRRSFTVERGVFTACEKARFNAMS